MKYLLFLLALAIGQKAPVVKTELHPIHDYSILGFRGYSIPTKLLFLKQRVALFKENKMFTVFQTPMQFVRTWHDWQHRYWRPPEFLKPWRRGFFI